MSELSVADALLLNNKQNNCDMFGGNNWIWVLFLFFIFGWGNNGNRNASTEGMYTRAAVNEGFNFNQLDNGIRSVQNGICDATYALKSAIDACCCQTQRAVDSVKYDMSQGFCGINRNIDNVRYEMSKGFSDVINANNLNTREILQNQNAGVQKILDYMCANEKQALRDKIQTLETSGIVQAQTRNLIETLRPCAVPAYITCSPYESARVAPVNYGCGYGCGY